MHGVVQVSRVAKKVGQRVLGKTLFHRVGAFAADAPDYGDRLRRTSHFTIAVDHLKSTGVLAADLDPGELRETHIGRVLTFGMLLAHLDAGPDIHARPTATGRGIASPASVGSARPRMDDLQRVGTPSAP